MTKRSLDQALHTLVRGFYGRPIACLPTFPHSFPYGGLFRPKWLTAYRCDRRSRSWRAWQAWFEARGPGCFVSSQPQCRLLQLLLATLNRNVVVLARRGAGAIDIESRSPKLNSFLQNSQKLE